MAGALAGTAQLRKSVNKKIAYEQKKIVFFSSKTSQGFRYGVGGLGGGSIAYNWVELYNERKREACTAQNLNPYLETATPPVATGNAFARPRTTRSRDES